MPKLVARGLSHDEFNEARGERTETFEFKRLVAFCCVVRAIAIPGTFLVFGLFWGLVYDGSSVKVLDCLTHGGNFGVMLIDLVLSRQSYRLVHGVYYFVFAMIYVIWTVIFHTSELDRPCACSEDDDEPAQMGCREAGDDDGADECNYIYSSLNWAGATRGKTLTLAAVILLVIVPIVVMGFHVLVLVLRAYLAPVAPLENRQLQREDSLLTFKTHGYCKALAYEFQWERLKPSIPEWATSFRNCRFPGVSDSVYMLIRVGLAIFMAAVMVWSIASEPSVLWLIYLTHWTLVVEVLYLSTAAYLTVKSNELNKGADIPERAGVIEMPVASPHL